MPVAAVTPRSARRRRATALLAAAGILLAGCAAPEKHQAAVPVASPSAAPGESPAQAALGALYDQTLQWTECGSLQCATATVPVDYEDPAGATIELALTRLPARSGEAVGSLLVNPGGPGASGVDFVESAAQRISGRVLERYDLVGFDPRGVARSSPVTCLGDAEMDALLARDVDVSSDAGIEDARAAYRELGQACAENTGPLLAHVGTASVARDLDLLRAVLGDDLLTYLGYSYGTSIGATYAELFPERVGRLVLDGALDPRLTSTEVSIGQAAGFEGALRAYIADCQGGEGCPLSGSVDEGMAQIHGLLDRARRNPLETGSDRRLTASLAFTGIIFPLYDDEFWPVLTEALTSALRESDGSVLLALADAYNGRLEDGTFETNQTEAFIAVSCLDRRASSDLAVMRAEAERIGEAAPTVGEFFSFGGVACQDWPHPPTGEPGPVRASGAAPILVVGTTNDPATPYAWSQGLAEQLESGVLLTWEGDGHTAYGRSGECVADVVDAYLLEGTVPPDGTTC